jgi:hypothetical protein
MNAAAHCAPLACLRVVSCRVHSRDLPHSLLGRACPFRAPSCNRSVSVGILFVSYALHIHFHPFLDPSRVQDIHERHGTSFLTRGVQLVYVRVVEGVPLSSGAL